jgi:small subunit ribosomal protein S8
MMTDPLADMLTRIRNAGIARHAETRCPSSRMKLAVAQVLVEEGFLESCSIEPEEGRPQLKLGIRYDDDGLPLIDRIRRVSRPGCRVYVGVSEIPRVRAGLGSAVLSTPKGILSDRAARAENVGGELLCEVW